jgi:hypothetical protein
MQARSFLQRTALVTAAAVAPIMIAGAAQAADNHGHAATECATVKVKATPNLNTAMVPETITSKVTSCATTTETVKLVQHISGPQAAAPMDKTWTITLSPGQTVKKVRHFPYSCCGSYTVTDTVTTTGGHQLAKAGSSFTFA